MISSDPESVIKISHALRDQIHTYAPLIDQLRQYAQNDAVYAPNVGHLGDGLIGLGALDLFYQIGIVPRILDPVRVGLLSSAQYLIVGGGKALELLWTHHASDIRTFFDQGGQAVVLPCRLLGLQPVLEKYASQLTLFASERDTFDRLNSYGGLPGRVHLLHDLAFAIDVSVFRRAYNADKPLVRDGVLNSFSDEKQENARRCVKHNCDLSQLWNDICWQEREDCIRRLQPVADLLSTRQTVNTDNVHMAIFATLLGCEVQLYSGQALANKAVFAHSLSAFPNIQFTEAASDGRTVFACPERTSLPYANSVTASSELIESEESVYRKLNEELQRTRERNLVYARHMDNLRQTDSQDHILVKLQGEVAALKDELETVRVDFDRYQEVASVRAIELDAIRDEYERFKADATQRENTLRSEHHQALLEYKVREDAYINSRGYRLWSRYNHLYQLPVLGKILGQLRAALRK